MEPVVSHDDVMALLGAYALNAVDPEEAALVAEHLAVCPRCAAEVDQHRGTASLLANLGGDAPEGLWDRISAELRPADAGAVPDLPVPDLPVPDLPGPDATTRPGSAPAVPSLGGRRRGSGSPARRGGPAGGRRWTWAAVPALVAAAAVVIALLAVQVGRLDGRVGRLSALADHQGMPALAEAALADPQAERVALQLAGATHRTVGDLVILPDGQAYLVEGDLPALPAGHTYQLWAVTGDQAVSLGLLGRHPQVVAFELGPTAPVTAFAVTAEPAGGVVVATGPPVAEGTVRSA